MTSTVSMYPQTLILLIRRPCSSSACGLVTAHPAGFAPQSAPQSFRRDDWFLRYDAGRHGFHKTLLIRRPCSHAQPHRL